MCSSRCAALERLSRRRIVDGPSGADLFQGGFRVCTTTTEPVGISQRSVPDEGSTGVGAAVLFSAFPRRGKGPAWASRRSRLPKMELSGIEGLPLGKPLRGFQIRPGSDAESPKTCADRAAALGANPIPSLAPEPLRAFVDGRLHALSPWTRERGECEGIFKSQY